MAISFVQVSYTVSTLTATEPVGTAAGDVMVACFMSGDHTAMTGPAGWTQLNQVNGTGVSRCSTWWIVRGGSAPSFVWAGPNAAASSIEILTYRGTHATTPTDGSAMVEVLGSATPNSQSITTTVANDWLVCFDTSAAADPGVLTVPSGMTSRFNKPSSDWFAGADLALGAAGATGAKQWTQGNATDSIVSSVALQPAAAGAAVEQSHLLLLGVT